MVAESLEQPDSPDRRVWGNHRNWRDSLKSGLSQQMVLAGRSADRRAISDSNVVVQSEFVRVRSLTDCFDLVLCLVPDPRIDHVVGEHVSAEQEIVIVA